MKKFRIPCIVITIMLAGLVVYTTVAAQQSKEKTSGAKVHVAIFDSRALAIAYYRSEPFKRQINEMKAECEKAKAQGDEKRVKELETEGPALQELAHKQGFSTWPVDNILENIKEKIPEIAKEANVDIIISKWAITYQRSEIEFVDVTDLMVKLFNPDEETLKIVKEIHKHDPIPLEEIEGHQWK
ncbi:MAG: hypothetical protein JW829_15175 [Pirellulales bacterium]|nr:hypothetical protein [Pirellulales bacterium]